MVVDIQKIIAYENGYLSALATIEMLADLIKSGAVWQLPGDYSRAAHAQIEAGYITRDGEVTEAGIDWANLVDAAQLEHDEEWLGMETP